LFRVEGRIDAMDMAANTLSVCDIRRVSDDGAPSPNPRDVCVFTAPNGATSYFDMESIPLASGYDGLALNDAVVMYGKFDPASAQDAFVPAVIAMGSRDTFNRERGISSEFVPDAGDPSAPGVMNLDEVNATCLLAPNERPVSVADETAVFSEDPAGDATRVSRGDIDRCRATEVEGTVVDQGLADEYLRAFVVLQGDPVVAEEELVGTLSAVAGQADTYTLTTPAPASTERCVRVDDNTVVTQITTSGGTSTSSTLTTVPTDETVTVVGTLASDDCLLATDIILEN
jgi:hypothetical protein